MRHAPTDAYADALATLTRGRVGGGRPGNLSHVVQVYNRLCQQQQQQPKYVHVVGSNGKGSTAWIVTRMLEQQYGLRVGLYTSPHIASIRERIQVDGKPVSKADFIEAVRHVNTIESLVAAPQSLSYFEATTLVAFAIFQNAQVDVQVIEAGMGGQGDATNVIKNPAVIALTSVSMEHVAFLGPTLLNICKEKCGVFKPGAIVVAGSSLPVECLHYAQQHANTVGCAKFIQASKPTTHTSTTWMENNQIAQICVKELVERFHLRQTAAATTNVLLRPPCRFTIIPISPSHDVILDVAHNPQALSRLVQQFMFHVNSSKQHTTTTPTNILVMGLAKDKDMHACLDAVLANMKWSQIVFVHPTRLVSRAFTNPQDLMVEASKNYPDNHIVANHDGVRAVIQQLVRDNKANVLVCGSHGLMLDCLIALGQVGVEEDADPWDMNEPGYNI